MHVFHIVVQCRLNCWGGTCPLCPPGSYAYALEDAVVKSLTKSTAPGNFSKLIATAFHVLISCLERFRQE